MFLVIIGIIVIVFWIWDWSLHDHSHYRSSGRRDNDRIFDEHIEESSFFSGYDCD